MEIEDKLIIAKLADKIKLCKIRHKIENTEFLTIYQQHLIQRELNKQNVKDYIFFGGYEEAESKILFLYPEKLDKTVVIANLQNIIKIIKIVLPKSLNTTYTHRDYLGSVMQTGLNRNRIGDIIVHEGEAYIVVLKENAEYIVQFLSDLKKFSKSKIEIINYKEVKTKAPEFEEIKILVSSVRIDNIISQVTKLSRGKVEQLLKAEKFFINSKIETKPSKALKESDIFAIRGYGKYVISNILEENRKGKIPLIIKKYK